VEVPAGILTVLVDLVIELKAACTSDAEHEVALTVCSAENGVSRRKARSRVILIVPLVAIHVEIK
jgi:hypothetical protein